MNNARMSISIPEEEHNYFIFKPKGKFLESIEKELEDWEHIKMNIDNVGTGCGGVSISFGGEGTVGYDEDAIAEGSVFGFIASKETLQEIINGLQFALDTCD